MVDSFSLVGESLVRWKWPLVTILAGLLAWWLWPHLLLSEGKTACRLSVGSSADDPADKLVVLLHGLDGSPQDLAGLEGVVRDSRVLDDPDILQCELPFDLFSIAQPEEVVSELVKAIDRVWAQRSEVGSPYRHIYLVGHSMGGLFVRKAYVVASGETAAAPFEAELRKLVSRDGSDGLVEARPWAGAVERVVLLAGINRGWSISHHLHLGRAALLKAGVVLGRVIDLRIGRFPLIFSIRRGAPFITELRLQWLAMRQSVRKDPERAGGAMTVQLLGSVDDLVSPTDNVDLVSGSDFVYLDVPWSGHADVIAMELTPAGEVGAGADHGQRSAPFHRAERLRWALVESRSELASRALLPVDDPHHLQGDDGVLTEAGRTTYPTAQGRRVDDVVFVIHGIRDEGYWTQKIARRVIARARRQGRTVVSETATYGYFPMLSFLRPSARRAKVEWLMDRYTEAKARYPAARFHFVGHSNGTYLLARALHEYPAVRFHRVVFAGSVVRTDYSWSEAMERGQIGAVLNFVASGDWVVAFFPKALELTELQDLGSAGHDGFDQPTVVQPRGPGGDLAYVRGGHGAALNEGMWDQIADFVVSDTVPAGLSTQLATGEDAGLFIGHQVPFVSIVGRVAPLIWVVIAVLLLAGLYGLVHLPIREWQRTVAVLAYLWLIWTIVTRV